MKPTPLARRAQEFAIRRPSWLTPEELAEAWRCGLEPDPAGADRLIGRDPARMTHDELRALGHTPERLAEALRVGKPGRA
jgi:hypothetical protein